MKTGRIIMIVGNGDVPAGAGAMIDAADVVIRFNDCRSVGASGTKTDIVAVCNTGRPALSMLGGSWKSNSAVRQAWEIWSVRSGGKFANMRAELAKTYPDLGDFCDDYTTDFESFAQATGRRHRVIAAAVHEQVDRDLARFGPAPYAVPSSGMIVIADVLSSFATRDDDVVLAGFDHFGWELHPFAAERQFVDVLAAEGRLRRLLCRS
ncbi:Urease operon accessory protein [Phyllobacterium phragmitis]|uniref:Urease operon accessory protein n=1 Tax=Phyllobacterium phragmitis TaxID=2670329 RepID=A0A2S9IQP1_9HYPH|nr:glycosyltransferase family 29 protein [Phyllobacterium phragmitis]PRD42846.1 Urease operon accessory protein [Phyllobacterium phragmitis]